MLDTYSDEGKILVDLALSLCSGYACYDGLVRQILAAAARSLELTLLQRAGSKVSPVKNETSFSLKDFQQDLAR